LHGARGGGCRGGDGGDGGGASGEGGGGDNGSGGDGGGGDGDGAGQSRRMMVGGKNLVRGNREGAVALQVDASIDSKS